MLTINRYLDNKKLIFKKTKYEVENMHLRGT